MKVIFFLVVIIFLGLVTTDLAGIKPTRHKKSMLFQAMDGGCIIAMAGISILLIFVFVIISALVWL